MTDQQYFEGQTVLITGAGRGLGLAYARTIGQLGATVLLHDVGANTDGEGNDPAVASAAAGQLAEEGIDAHAFHAPIETHEQCHALVQACLDVNGHLDAFIHNAGWVAYASIEQIEDAAFDRAMAVMAKAPLWIAQAAWSSLRQAGYGRIVLTTSCRALFPEYVHQGLAAYTAAKMAAVGLVNVLAAEGAAHGIVVNAVSPVAKTRMWGINNEPTELKPTDVAPGVAFLASSLCREGGWILRAANGQFHASRAEEASGVDYPRDLNAVSANTFEEVAERWGDIALATREARQVTGDMQTMRGKRS
ncbi:SDR family NAD(P)-dependent oxidoreductase [Kushneria aurantia]|uniref:SDR family NAD(P)-dependent oxidoreductase n=1 Tax=Kushneria aurantia TaxID=504092 RepID=A0ABV6G0L4_9GAMM|nr:SDR family NAD(P)-dependent oxidoreductase [Kushneria aurantia]